MKTKRKLSSQDDIEHLKNWVRETQDTNKKLRRKGVQPRYNCMIRRGYFYEERAA